MKVLLDLNIILDVLLKREPFFQEALQILEQANKGEIEGYIAGNSIDTLVYILQRNNKKQDEIKKILKEIRKFLYISEINGENIDLAIDSMWNDFEDTLVYFSAKLHYLEGIITRNTKDFKTIKDTNIKIYTPKEFITQITS